jgi:hypothetical protein
METSYLPIEPRFSSDNYDFCLLARQGDVALFAKHKGLHIVSFEVVVIRKRPAKDAFGRHFPAREAMPSSEQWGVYGWTHPHWPKAWELFHKKVAKFGFECSPQLVWEHANIFRGVEDWHIPGHGFLEEEWSRFHSRIRNLPQTHTMLPE